MRLNFAGQSRCRWKQWNAGGFFERRTLSALREGKFPTASGKAELYNESPQGEGLDPVATFVPPGNRDTDDSAKMFPLELLARKADNFLNSTFPNLPVTAADGRDWVCWR